MRVTIVIGDENRISLNPDSVPDRKFVYFRSNEESYLYHLEHPEVDSYLLLAGDLHHDLLSRIISHIGLLNEMTPVFLLGYTGDGSDDSVEFKNTFRCRTSDEFLSSLEAVPESHRKFNRVEWPVKAGITDHEKQAKDKGLVLSISSGGCLIKSDYRTETGDSLLITIIFQNFDFMAEGEVRRTEPGKFAIQFTDVSLQTKNFIQEIIDEKILSELKELD